MQELFFGWGNGSLILNESLTAADFSDEHVAAVIAEAVRSGNFDPRNLPDVCPRAASQSDSSVLSSVLRTLTPPPVSMFNIPP